MRALLILISLFLVGCAKEPTTLICTDEFKRTHNVVIDFEENLFIQQLERGTVYGNPLLISDNFYGWINQKVVEPTAINRKTLEYLNRSNYGKCRVTPFTESKLNELIAKGRKHWNKSKPPETNQI